MTGLGPPASSDQHRPLTESDLLAYASGEDLEEDVFDEITKQLAIVGSPAQRWMAELDAKSSRPFDIDWQKLACEGQDSSNKKSDGKAPSPGDAKRRVTGA